MMPSVTSTGWVAPPAIASSTRTVLIAEDDDAIRSMLSIILESEGYPIAAYPSGNRVLELFAAAQSVPYVLILDLQMADGDGLSVLQWLSDHPRQAGQTVVIVATAQTTPLPAWVQPLVQAVLIKPYDIEVLIGHVVRGAAA